MSTSKPTIVLVPGSFTSAGLAWDTVFDKLFDAGYDVQTVELQTVSPPSTAPAKTMADDAAHIHGVIEALSNDGKEVLLVMHSFGGIPGTQAVKGLTRLERQKAGKEGGITGLVYVTSLLVNEGENSDDSFAPFPRDINFMRVSGEYVYMDPDAAAPVVFAGIPEKEGRRLVRKLMPGHAMGSFHERMTSTSHYGVPVTYLKCTEDSLVLPAHQQKMIDDFKSVSKSSVNVVEVPSNHIPMLTHVDKTAEVIINAARRV